MNIKVENAEFPRTFVPEDANLGDWPQIEPLFEKLLNEKPQTAAELDAWLLKGSELAACVSEEGTRRHIAMTCQTDDPEAEKAFLHYTQEIEPRCKPYWDRLNRLYINHPKSGELARGKYFVYDRDTRRKVEIFREENVPLEMELAKLCQKYQKIIGAMTVMFDGRERTIAQMGPYLEKNDRSLRESAWKTLTERRLREKDTLEDLFDEMLALRRRIASNAGYKNFRDYSFDAMMRFDYTPKQCGQCHDVIEKVVVPASRTIQQIRLNQMKLNALRPWDLAADPLGRLPLRPFERAEQLSAGARRIFGRVSDELGEKFQSMIDRKLLDLDSRKGKAPGAYQSTLQEIRAPFIFMNAVGVDRDLWTILHEGGHAFHVFASSKEPLVSYRTAPLEFAEVASMSMELLGMPFLTEFYGENDARRSAALHLEGIVDLLKWVAIVDAFQHWLYTTPNHTRAERAEYWLSLMDRFGGIEDWSGLETARACTWHRQMHIFLYPFYYIEYGIAQLGALQIWRRIRANGRAALQNYLNALSLGASAPLPVLFETAGIRFDFGVDTIEPVIAALLREIEKM